jgi:DNA-binding CsgD family transcriptional regulator
LGDLGTQRGRVAGPVEGPASADAPAAPFIPFPQHVWDRLAQALKLSGRETQIIRSILQDRKETAIAADLGISPHTVHAHLERLYHKLGVSSRVQLVVRVFAEWVPLAAPPDRSPVRRPLRKGRPNRRL